MSRLEWDKTGERYYETGVDHCVLYLQQHGEYKKGVVWNGITAITEKPGGAETSDMWADNMKYASLRAAETFGATIEAYTFPDEFYECDGSGVLSEGVYLGQQSRNPFGLSYRTKIGNDTASEEDDGYKLHLVYGCTASPSEKGYSTVNDSPEAITLSWEMETTPVNIPGYKASATITINSLKVEPALLQKIEDALYGTENTEAYLPLPSEIIDILNSGEGPAPEERPKHVFNVAAATNETYGKQPSEYQSEVSVDNETHVVSGKLKKVTGWQSFSSNTDGQNGYYIALHITDTGETPGATMKFSIIGGKTQNKDLTEDGDLVIRLIDGETFGEGTSKQLQLDCEDIQTVYTFNVTEWTD